MDKSILLQTCRRGYSKESVNEVIWFSSGQYERGRTNDILTRTDKETGGKLRMRRLLRTHATKQSEKLN